MTWTKFGSEFFDDCANHGLSDAAVRTHAEAIGWLYNVESVDLTIDKHLIRRFAGSEHYEDAIKDLLAVEWWRANGCKYEVVHHADVIRQSLAAQNKKKARDKESSRTYRKRNGHSVSADVSADVSDDADRQTDKQAVVEKFPEEDELPAAQQLEESPSSTPNADPKCQHGVVNGDQPDEFFTDRRVACPQCALALKQAS